MKRILSLFASLLAAGTILCAQEYESVVDVLEDYGKLENFTCEVAEDTLYELVYIIWDDGILYIYVADGELPMDQFVVG